MRCGCRWRGMREPETTAVPSSRKVVALFHKQPNGRLEMFSLTTLQRVQGYYGPAIERNDYNVDWSKKYGYLWNMCGSGGGDTPIPVDGIYYASRDVTVLERPSALTNRAARRRNKTRRLPALPRKFLCNGGDLIDWLENNAIQGDSVYCSACRDCLPEDSLCDHCWWCDKIGWWSTPSERCGCANRESCHE